MYKKVRTRQIAEVAGITSPHETPENAELVVDTGRETLEQYVNHVPEAIMPREVVRMVNGEN